MTRVTVPRPPFRTYWPAAPCAAGGKRMDGTVDFLLVEDDHEDARLILKELEHEHLADKVMVLHDGEEALDFIFCRGAYSRRSPTHPPKVVVTDLKLPKIDGMQVLEEIKSKPETRAIPVV